MNQSIGAIIIAGLWRGSSVLRSATTELLLSARGLLLLLLLLSLLLLVLLLLLLVWIWSIHEVRCSWVSSGLCYGLLRLGAPDFLLSLRIGEYWLRESRRRGGKLTSVCSGAILLAVLVVTIEAEIELQTVLRVLIHIYNFRRPLILVDE